MRTCGRCGTVYSDLLPVCPKCKFAPEQLTFTNPKFPAELNILLMDLYTDPMMPTKYRDKIRKILDLKQKQYPIPVVCAVITHRGKLGKEVLLDIRHMPGNEAFDGKWQLPGGKVEFGETLEVAIRREIKEELNADIDRVNGPVAVASAFGIPEKHFILIAMACHLKDDSQLKLTDSLRWFNLRYSSKEAGVRFINKHEMTPHSYDLMMEVLNG